METQPLFYYTYKDILNLEKAIDDFINNIENKVFALLYSPNFCRFARMHNKKLVYLEKKNNGYGETDWEEKEALDSSVYEARIFCEKAELRWLKDPRESRDRENKGRVVVLSSNVYFQNLDGWNQVKETPTEKNIVEILPQTYLIWGEGTGKKMLKGWSELATSRIGALTVPISGVEKNQRVLLHTVEYFAQYEHGNVAVYDERLIELKKVKHD